MNEHLEIQDSLFVSRPVFVKFNKKLLCSTACLDYKSEEQIEPQDKFISKGSILVPYNLRKYNLMDPETKALVKKQSIINNTHIQWRIKLSLHPPIDLQCEKSMESMASFKENEK